MTHVLDRPIWSALTTRHADIAEGSARARRYGQGISLFAAARDDEAESLEALGDLARPGETMLMAQAGGVNLPQTLRAIASAPLVQMVLESSIPPIDEADIVPLDWTDAEAMLALAQLAKPGPFTAKALALGNFWGVRVGGRLVAMAGERLKQPGFTELSGVCTDPEFRGKGYGSRLSKFVSRRILAAGDTPYLHTHAANATAISLYESLGFRHRADLTFATIALAE